MATRQERAETLIDFNVRVPVDLKKTIKLKAIAEDTTIERLVTSALERAYGGKK